MPIENHWLNADELYVLQAFVTAGVRFLVIGDRAVQFHGHARPTKDLDLFVERSAANWKRLAAALKSVGTDLKDAFEDLSANPKAKGIVSFYAVEYLTAIQGVTFPDGWSESVLVTVNDLTVRVLSKPHLILSKQHTGRPVDTDDVKALMMTGASHAPSVDPFGG